MIQELATKVDTYTNLLMLKDMIIKRLIWIISLFISMPSYAQQTVKLDIKEAIAIALRDNIAVQNAYLTRINDKFSYLVAKDNYKPQYSLSTTTGYDSRISANRRIGTQNRNIAAGISLNLPSGGSLALTAVQAANFSTRSPRSHSGYLTLSYSQPLLRGFGKEIATANLTMAGYSDLSSQLALKSKLISTVTSVISQYRATMLSLRSLKIAESALKRAEESVITNTELIKAGRLATVNLVQSKTSVANKKLALRNAQNKAKTDRYSLLSLLRLDSNTPLELTQRLYVKPTKLKLRGLIATAKVYQSSYLQTKLNLKTAELARKVQRDNQRWDLSLTSSYTLSGAGNGLDKSIKGYSHLGDAGYVVGLTLKVPLDEISRDQRVLNSNISWLKARNNFIKSNETLRLSLLSAKQSIDSAWDNISLAEQALMLSKQQVKLEQEKQRAGKSTNFQVLIYQDSLVSAEKAYVAVQIAYLNELTNMDQMLGTTLKHWGIKIMAESQLQPKNINKMGGQNQSSNPNRAGN